MLQSNVNVLFSLFALCVVKECECLSDAELFKSLVLRIVVVVV